jgi:hypothetical protein
MDFFKFSTKKNRNACGIVQCNFVTDTHAFVFKNEQICLKQTVLFVFLGLSLNK